MGTIVNASYRMKRMQGIVKTIKDLYEAWDIKNPKTKQAKMVAHAVLATEYNHETDPVLYVAVLRGQDITELENFIELCQKQIESEAPVTTEAIAGDMQEQLEKMERNMRDEAMGIVAVSKKMESLSIGSGVSALLGVVEYFQDKLKGE